MVKNGLPVIIMITHLDAGREGPCLGELLTFSPQSDPFQIDRALHAFLSRATHCQSAHRVDVKKPPQ